MTRRERRNFYNYGPRKKRDATGDSEPRDGHTPRRSRPVEDDCDDDNPSIRELMMPGNYASRAHRDRKMPLRPPRLKP